MRAAAIAAADDVATLAAQVDALEQETAAAHASSEAALADCAAAPALFYSDWTHPIAATYPQLRAYRARLLARPSFARAVEGGRTYRHYFPLGAPDRD